MTYKEAETYTLGILNFMNVGIGVILFIGGIMSLGEPVAASYLIFGIIIATTNLWNLRKLSK